MAYRTSPISSAQTAGLKVLRHLVILYTLCKWLCSKQSTTPERRLSLVLTDQTNQRRIATMPFFEGARDTDASGSSFYDIRGDHVSHSVVHGESILFS
jgi:hypothetical protein